MSLVGQLHPLVGVDVGQSVEEAVEEAVKEAVDGEVPAEAGVLGQGGGCGQVQKGHQRHMAQKAQ